MCSSDLNDLLEKCDFATGVHLNGEVKHLDPKNHKELGRLISAFENFSDQHNGTAL